MPITREQVEQALDILGDVAKGETGEGKSSAMGEDSPEGADLGNPAKEKMSSAAKSEKPELKKGKGGFPPAEDKEEKDEDEEEDEMKEKSFRGDMPESIQEKIDVSDFLKSLVDHTGDTIESLKKSVDASNKDLTKSIEGIIETQSKMGIVLKAICERIGVIGDAPARPAKAETVVKSNVADRNFATAASTEGGEKMFKSLSDNPNIAKSQISGAMFEMLKKGEIKDLDIIGFESEGYIRPEIFSKLKNVL